MLQTLGGPSKLPFPAHSDPTSSPPDLTRVTLLPRSCSVPLFPGLSPSFQELLRTRPALPWCLLDDPDLEASSSLPLVLPGPPSDYAALALRMERCGMVRFVGRSELKVINGLFTQPKKDGSLRLLVEARRANLHFRSPPDPFLPRPDQLAALRLPPNATLHAALCDLSHYYDQLSLDHPATQYLCSYFGLPEVSRDYLPSSLLRRLPSGPIHPMLLCVPQGWCWGVSVAQNFHTHLVRSLPPPAISPLPNVPPPTSVPRRGVLILVYIDDVCFLSLDPALLHWAVASYRSLIAGPGLLESVHKAVPPTQTAQIYGIVLDRNVLRPRWPSLVSLLRDTRALICSPRTSTRAVESLTGRWLWLLLLNRPLLSSLSRIYAFTSTRRAPRRQLRRFPEAAKHELRTLVAFVPFMFARLSPPHFSRMVATDASNWGQGVVVTDIPPRIHLAYPRLFHLQRASWFPIVSSPWNGPEHINLLELRALLTAVRWAASSPHSAGALLTIFCDSQVVCGALSTGRSSSRKLNNLLRALTSILLAYDMRLHVVWCPTGINPADHASRRQF